jgi:ring-1,2-phenylacetyl-CoA epoxidase subunit PaaE
MIKYTLKVQEIRRETADTVTLCFKQPALRKIKYQAGQYITLQLRINGRRYSRPYSFSSAPAVDSLLETTIKRVPRGIASNYVHDQVQTGDVIEVMEPMGDFVFDNQEGVEKIYFWGVGSGITPLISLIKEILHTKPLIKLHLVYGNRNFGMTIFSLLINELADKFPETFSFTHFHTQAEMNQENFFVKKGRIQKDFILDLVQASDVAKTMHYICGPTDLKNKIKDTLSLLKYPSANVFSEDFELVKDPKDFEDLMVQHVKISFQGNDTLVKVEKGKSVLEAALDAGIELPYSCQTGNCSTCKAKLKVGALRMIGLTKGRDDLEKDDYLLCCSHPLTDNVYLEI